MNLLKNTVYPEVLKEVDNVDNTGPRLSKLAV